MRELRDLPRTSLRSAVLWSALYLCTMGANVAWGSACSCRRPARCAEARAWRGTAMALTRGRVFGGLSLFFIHRSAVIVTAQD
ncbi:hypothetical protein C8R46DRAFT_1127640 [Mycena filopes]|nr:hypothetical protein C8R46DRAFT_1127640 [Mycena filopes]